MTLEILRQHHKKSIEMKQIEEQIARLEAQLQSPQRQVITDMPKGGQAPDMAAQVAKLVDLKRYYEDLWDSYIDERKEIERWILTFDDPVVRAILRCKYVEGLPDRVIGQKLYYSEDRIKHIRLQILKNVNP